jgi:RNA polymerase sigma factor (sigma-70 family)
MTTRSEPGDGRLDQSQSAIMSERHRLVGLAYRLLGSLADAEDVVQETYARWYAMSKQKQEAIESPGSWLTRVASRICYDLLGSARARRESYVGEWIPEPLPDRTEWISGRSGAATVDPADRITLDESVNMAFLVVLESMTPAERVAFILHDVFRYPFGEGPRSSAVRRRHVASWPRRHAVAFARRRHPRLRRPGAPASSEPSRRHGKPGTSTPSSASSTPTPRRSATAAWPAPPPTRSKAASRSRASSSISPARHSARSRSRNARSTASPVWWFSTTGSS